MTEDPLPGPDRVPVRVVIADDHAVVRYGLAELLSGSPRSRSSGWSPTVGGGAARQELRPTSC